MRFFFLLLTFIFAATPALAEGKHFVFNTPESTSRAPAKVLEKAYDALGITFEVHPMPGQRALVEANAGKADGELYRIHLDKQIYSNLIRIPVVIDYFDSVYAITREPLESAHLDDVAELRIGILRGLKFAEELTRQMPNVTTISEWEQLWRMLDRERIDVVITPKRINATQDVNIENGGFAKTRITDARVNLYHYLHSRHADIVPELTRTLRHMEKSGAIKAILAPTKLQ